MFLTFLPSPILQFELSHVAYFVSLYMCMRGRVGRVNALQPATMPLPILEDPNTVAPNPIALLEDLGDVILGLPQEMLHDNTFMTFVPHLYELIAAVVGVRGSPPEQVDVDLIPALQPHLPLALVQEFCRLWLKFVRSCHWNQDGAD